MVVVVVELVVVVVVMATMMVKVRETQAIRMHRKLPQLLAWCHHEHLKHRQCGHWCCL